jgi:hypothetical protein
MLVPNDHQLRSWIKVHEDRFWLAMTRFHSSRILGPTTLRAMADTAAAEATILAELRQELINRGG